MCINNYALGRDNVCISAPIQTCDYWLPTLYTLLNNCYHSVLVEHAQKGNGSLSVCLFFQSYSQVLIPVAVVVESSF